MKYLDEIINLAKANDNEISLTILDKYNLSEKEYVAIIKEVESRGIKVLDIEKNNVPEDEDLTDEVKIFLREAGRYPALSREEEIELFKAYNSGDEKAKEKIINSNLRLVIYIAKHFTRNKYQFRNIPLIDLIQEGSLGLIKAVERFDITKGYKFSTFAYWWIVQSIERAKYSSTTDFYVPDHMKYKINKVKAHISYIYNQTGEKITIEKACKDLGYNSQAVEEAIALFESVVNIDKPINEDEDSHMVDILSNGIKVEQAVIESVFYSEVDQFLKDYLSPKEYEILKYRYENNMSLKNIGYKYNVTRERIRQIEKKALKKSRKKLKYLGFGDLNKKS